MYARKFDTEVPFKLCFQLIFSIKTPETVGKITKTFGNHTIQFGEIWKNLTFNHPPNFEPHLIK